MWGRIAKEVTLAEPPPQYTKKRWDCRRALPPNGTGECEACAHCLGQACLCWHPSATSLRLWNAREAARRWLWLFVNCWTSKPEIIRSFERRPPCQGFVQVCCTFATAQTQQPTTTSHLSYSRLSEPRTIRTASVVILTQRSIRLPRGIRIQ